MWTRTLDTRKKSDLKDEQKFCQLFFVQFLIVSPESLAEGRPQKTIHKLRVRVENTAQEEFHKKKNIKFSSTTKNVNGYCHQYILFGDCQQPTRTIDEQKIAQSYLKH